MADSAGPVITDKSGLRHLTSHKARSSLLLKLDGLESEETLQWQTRLNSLRSDCGCSMGTVFAIGGLALYLLLLWPSGLLSFAPLWIAVLAGLGVLVGSAGLGKAIGILWARKRFAEAVTGLINLLDRRLLEKEANHALREVER